MDMLNSRRIVLLGKTGVGKSSLANTIFGEKLFTPDHSPNSGSCKCQAETKPVNGRSVTLIDTPGFFDTDGSEDVMRPEIVRCITECAPGPHAFLIVLKVEKFTKQEEAVITKIHEYFSEEVFKYAAVIFTHGDGLLEGMKIEDFVSQNENLSDLVTKCGGRCHVIDDKYWKKKLEDEYRSNQVHVTKLLNTIEEMVKKNKGGYYTNEMLQEVEKAIQEEDERIRQAPGDMSETEIRNKAKMSVFERLLIRFAGFATGALLGALLGVTKKVLSVVREARLPSSSSELVSTAASGAQHWLAGGLTGYNAVEGAENPLDAAKMGFVAVWKESGLAGRNPNNI